MEKKVNVLEILKQYPIGVVLYDLLIKRKVVFSGFEKLNDNVLIKCVCCGEQDADPRYYNRYGAYVKDGYSRLTLVPSEENCDWANFDENGFKDGDLLAAKVGNDSVIYIKRGDESEIERLHFYVLLYVSKQKLFFGNGLLTSGTFDNVEDISFATDVERVLFKVILDKNGWNWNESERKVFFSGKTPACYFSAFDKVLVRSGSKGIWRPSFFGYRGAGNEDNPFVCINGSRWEQCIPYIGNEKLIGTSDTPCSLTWKSYEESEAD